MTKTPPPQKGSPTGTDPVQPAAPSTTEMAELFLRFAAAERHVMWVFDLLPSEHVSYLSPAFETLSGMNAQAVYADSRAWVSSIIEEDLPAVSAVIERWIADPFANAFDVEYRIRRPDGELRWFHTLGHTPERSTAHLGRRTGISEDVTERRLAYERQRAEKERLETMAAVVPSALCSFRRKADGSLSVPFGSERVAQMCGVSDADLTHDARAAWNRIHPDDMAPMISWMDESSRNLSTWRVEFRVCDTTGSVRWIEGHGTPVAEPEGAFLWHGTITDITARKQTEQALAESQRRLNAVVQHMSDGLLVYSSTGKLTRWNPAALKLHELTDAQARELTLESAAQLYEVRALDGTLIPPTQWPHALIMAGQVLNHHESRLRRLDSGWEKVISYSGSRIDDAQGKPLFGLLQCSDVTQRRKTDEDLARLNEELEKRVQERTSELQAAIKEIEAFSYSVSHDLRAPLRALDGFSQVLIEDHGHLLPDEAQRYLGIIRGTTQKMGRLIDDLLAFSRLGRQALTRRPINCAQLVNHVYESLAAQRNGRQIEFRLGELADCEADLALLQQVWMNLIGNAIKYTGHRRDALIEVGSASAGSGAEYFVRDNGAGFDMRYAHKLFRVFERLHRAEDFEGTGVGLAIVQRIVERHGGRVRAEAEVGRGATFYFTLC